MIKFVIIGLFLTGIIASLIFFFTVTIIILGVLCLALFILFKVAPNYYFAKLRNTSIRTPAFKIIKNDKKMAS